MKQQQPDFSKMTEQLNFATQSLSQTSTIQKLCLNMLGKVLGAVQTSHTEDPSNLELTLKNLKAINEGLSRIKKGEIVYVDIETNQVLPAEKIFVGPKNEVFAQFSIDYYKVIVNLNSGKVLGKGQMLSGFGDIKIKSDGQTTIPCRKNEKVPDDVTREYVLDLNSGEVISSDILKKKKFEHYSKDPSLKIFREKSLISGRYQPVRVYNSRTESSYYDLYDNNKGVLLGCNSSEKITLLKTGERECLQVSLPDGLKNFYHIDNNTKELALVAKGHSTYNLNGVFYALDFSTPDRINITNLSTLAQFSTAGNLEKKDGDYSYAIMSQGFLPIREGVVLKFVNLTDGNEVQTSANSYQYSRSHQGQVFIELQDDVSSQLLNLTTGKSVTIILEGKEKSSIKSAESVGDGDNSRLILRGRDPETHELFLYDFTNKKLLPDYETKYNRLTLYISPKGILLGRPVWGELLVDLDQNKIVTVAGTSPHAISAPFFAPDGTGYAYVTMEGKSHKTDLLNLETGKLVTKDPDVFFENKPPILSPEGHLLVKAHYRGKRTLFNLTTNKPLNLGEFALEESALPTFLPDGGMVLKCERHGYEYRGLSYMVVPN